MTYDLPADGTLVQGRGVRRTDRSASGLGDAFIAEGSAALAANWQEEPLGSLTCGFTLLRRLFEHFNALDP
jgi:hypothetical protein